MAATNISAWAGNLDGATEPLLIKGLIQAGSTQAIKVGELVTWNETSGYWIPISAASDAQRYLLGFANEEISTLTASAARYTTIIVPRPADVFSIELASAASVEFGANYIPTGSNSQTATLDADGLPVFNSVGDANYPVATNYGGTTVASESHGLFTVNPEYSYYRRLVRLNTHKKVITVGAALTLLDEWSGAIIVNTGATTAYQVDLPQNCATGTYFIFTATAAQALRVHSAGGGIYIKGGKQADSKYVGVADEGEFIHVVHVGSNDWVAYASPTGEETGIAVET